MKNYTLNPSPGRARAGASAPEQDAPRAGGARPAPPARVPRDYAPDGGGNPLTRGQKARLCILAKRAADRAGLPESGPEHDAWRAEEAVDCCGRRISAALQRHWPALHARFADLAGDVATAFKTLVAESGNPRRVALWKLRKALEEAGLDESYAAKICRDQYKCRPDEATAPQLWRLVFTVKNRGANK